MAQTFMDKDHFFTLLQEEGTADFLRFSHDEEFAAECAFFNQWNSHLNHGPEEDGLDEISAQLVPINAPDSVHVTAIYQGEEILIVYEPHAEFPQKPALEIYYNTNLVYGREAGQSATFDFYAKPFFG